MERKFRLIEKLSYTHDDLDEKITIHVQEWKKNWRGKWKWVYWEKSNYDVMEKRTFKTIHEARKMVNKYVKQHPYTKVIEEFTF